MEWWPTISYVFFRVFFVQFFLLHGLTHRYAEANPFLHVGVNSLNWFLQPANNQVFCIPHILLSWMGDIDWMAASLQQYHMGADIRHLPCTESGRIQRWRSGMLLIPTFAKKLYPLLLLLLLLLRIELTLDKNQAKTQWRNDLSTISRLFFNSSPLKAPKQGPCSALCMKVIYSMYLFFEALCVIGLTHDLLYVVGDNTCPWVKTPWSKAY